MGYLVRLIDLIMFDIDVGSLIGDDLVNDIVELGGL